MSRNRNLALVDGLDQLGRTGFHDGLGLAVGLVIAKTGSLSGESPSFRACVKLCRILHIFGRPAPPLAQPFLDRLANRHPLANRERLGRFVLVAFGDQRPRVVEINDGRGDRSRLRAGINLWKMFHKSWRHGQLVPDPAHPRPALDDALQKQLRRVLTASYTRCVQIFEGS